MRPLGRGKRACLAYCAGDHYVGSAFLRRAGTVAGTVGGAPKSPGGLGCANRAKEAKSGPVAAVDSAPASWQLGAET